MPKEADRDAEIARIESSNAQKQREFQENSQKSNPVKELNENLGDWYYVISNESSKDRLDRADFVKTKEKEVKEKPEEVQASTF